jgi:hypothetical protein
MARNKLIYSSKLIEFNHIECVCFNYAQCIIQLDTILNVVSFCKFSVLFVLLVVLL